MLRRGLEGVSKGLRRGFEGNKGILHFCCVAVAAAWLPRCCTGIARPRLSNCNSAVVMTMNALECLEFTSGGAWQMLRA